jgi:hypothetical protein
MFVKVPFNKAEINFLRKLELSNNEEMLSWRLPNLYYPLAVIVASLACFLLFKDSDKKNFVAFMNLLLNGSIPMVALNRLSSLGINLFKFDKGKEKAKSNNSTYTLRVKIHYYSQLLVFCIALFYIFQVIHSPFPLSYWIILQFIFAALCIDQSLKVSKYAFLLQEKLLDITYEQEVREEIKTKGHGENWDKEQ